jgi:COMPASS component SWD3
METKGFGVKGEQSETKRIPRKESSIAQKESLQNEGGNRPEKKAAPRPRKVLTEQEALERAEREEYGTESDSSGDDNLPEIKTTPIIANAEALLESHQHKQAENKAKQERRVAALQQKEKEADVDHPSLKGRTQLSTEVRGHKSTEVFCLAYSPDSNFLAAGMGDGSVRVYNRAGRLAYFLNVPTLASLPTTCLSWRPMGAASENANVLLVANSEGTISHWHVTAQTRIFCIAEDDNEVYTVDYSPDGQYFAAAGRDCKVRLYSEARKSLTTVFTAGPNLVAHSNRVYCCKFAPWDSNLLVSGGWDNTVQLWDVRTGTSMRGLYGPHICGEGLSVHPTKPILLAAAHSSDNQLSMWDLRTNKQIISKSWSSFGSDDLSSAQMLYACAFSPSGHRIAAGGAGINTGAKIITSDLSEELDSVHLRQGVFAVAFSPSGTRLAVAGSHHSVVVMDV